ncbi:MAG: hypothetical protein ACRDGU_02245 [Actinomycetota bacterium]
MEGKPDRISRRRMLKRVGAGAAIAWSAPVLSSLRTPAFAQYVECPQGCAACAGQVPCGRVDQGCTCIQALDPVGGCFCHDIVFCDNPGVVACTEDSDCQAGWRCSNSCCGNNLCHPPCGAGQAPLQAGAAGGATSAG